MASSSSTPQVAAGNSPVGVSNPSINNELSLPPIPYADNSTQFVSLPRGFVYRWLNYNIAAQPTAAASWTAANLGTADLLSLIKNVRIVRNNSDTLVNMTGEECAYYANRMYGGSVNSVIGTSAAQVSGQAIGGANPWLNCNLFIPFEGPQFKRSIQTLLNSAKMSDFQIQVDFNNYASVISTATAWTTPPTLTGSYSSLFWQAGQKPGTPIFNFGRRIPTILTLPAGTGSEQQFPLEVNTQYWGIQLLMPAGNLLSKVRILSAGTVYRDYNLPGRWAVEKLRRNVQPIGLAASTNNDQNIYMFNFVSDGSLREMINAVGLGSLTLGLTYTGSGGSARALALTVLGNDS